jgi:hypothetical protein
VPDAAVGHVACFGANWAGCFCFGAVRTGTGVTAETAVPNAGTGADTDAWCGTEICGASGTTSENAAARMIDFVRRSCDH